MAAISTACSRPATSNMFETPIASRNLMLAHGAAVKVYREVGAHEIGLVVNIEPKYPACDARGMRRGRSRRRLHEPPISRPRVRRGYPPEMEEIFGEAWRDWPAEDLAGTPSRSICSASIITPAA